eukprot:s1090_g4.t1
MLIGPAATGSSILPVKLTVLCFLSIQKVTFAMALIIRSVLALLAAHLAAAQQQQQGGGMNPFAAMGGDQMIDSLCKSFPNPLCPKKAVGAKSPDCQKNPNACCPDAVRKCSDTSVDTFFGSVCPKSMGAGAKCLGHAFGAALGA